MERVTENVFDNCIVRINESIVLSNEEKDKLIKSIESVKENGWG